MEKLNILSILFYCLFSFFVFYQQKHLKTFNGASKIFELILSISCLLGMITGFVYFGYYGYKVVWWAPVVIFLIGMLSFSILLFIEKIVGGFTLSLLGFIIWPVCAFLMFKYIPVGGNL